MNFNEQLDFKLKKKSAPKQGRRAGNISPDITDSLLDSALENVGSPPSSPSVKIGGWADETLKPAKIKNSTNLIELERFQGKTKEVDDIDDIPVIPDLDDFQDDPIIPSEVKPSSTALISESIYKELDNELQREMPDEPSSSSGEVKPHQSEFYAEMMALLPKFVVEGDDDTPLTFEMLQEELFSSCNLIDSTMLTKDLISKLKL